MILDRVEGVEEDAPGIAAVAQSVEYRQAIPITGHRLAIDEAGVRAGDLEHRPPEGSLSVLVGRHGAMNPAGKVRCNMRTK